MTCVDLKKRVFLQLKENGFGNEMKIYIALYQEQSRSLKLNFGLSR